jgi:hypothetical protein
MVWNRKNKIKICTYLDEAFKALSILLLEGDFDVCQIALSPRDDYPDKCPVISAGASHTVVQSLSKVDRAVGHALDNGQHSGFDGTGELVLDDFLEGHAMSVLVGLEHLAQVCQTPGCQNSVERRLIRADFVLS